MAGCQCHSTSAMPSRAVTAIVKGSRSLAMTSSTTASSMLKYSWIRKFRMARSGARRSREPLGGDGLR